MSRVAVDWLHQSRAALNRTHGEHTILQLWHLCSLDAPTVASCWTAFIAHVIGLTLPLTSYASMFLAVWMLYAGDRLLDARLNTKQQAELEERHFFHSRHRKLFCAALIACAAVLSRLLVNLTHAELHLYATLGSLLFGYFFAIHVWPLGKGAAKPFPKEFAVGFFFSAAVFIPTVARVPSMRVALLPSAVLFGLVCALNCIYVYAWEHSKACEKGHWAIRFVTSRIGETACCIFLLCLAGVGVAKRDPVILPVALTCGISVLGFIALHRLRRRLAPATLRAAVDLMLIMPLPVVALITTHTR